MLVTQGPGGCRARLPAWVHDKQGGSNGVNDLQRYAEQNPGRLIHKWKHYFEIYDRHFARFRGSDVCLVEFGVYQGGSLQMWKHYFGPRARIVGVDINPHCKACEEDQIEVIIGDQEDRRFLKSLRERIPRIDILIDDGGHTMQQQIRTHEELFPHIDPHGVYLCEDVHTSYEAFYGGGYRKRGTFMEYSKDLLDRLHGWRSETSRLRVSEFTRSAQSLHFYESVLVIEKRPVGRPEEVKTGVADIPYVSVPPRLGLRIGRRLSMARERIRRLLG